VPEVTRVAREQAINTLPWQHLLEARVQYLLLNMVFPLGFDPGYIANSLGSENDCAGEAQQQL
jgi:hypothetical protein